MWGMRVLANVAVGCNEIQQEYGDPNLLAEIEWGLYFLLCVSIFAGAVQLPILCFSALRTVLLSSDERSNDTE